MKNLLDHVSCQLVPRNTKCCVGWSWKTGDGFESMYAFLVFPATWEQGTTSLNFASSHVGKLKDKLNAEIDDLLECLSQASMRRSHFSLYAQMWEDAESLRVQHVPTLKRSAKSNCCKTVMCRSNTLPCFQLASVFHHGTPLLCSNVGNASHSLIPPTPFVQLIFHTLLSSVDAFAVEPRKACKCSRANHFIILLYL